MLWGWRCIKKLVLLIPCYNEEKGIGHVIDNIPYEKLSEYVIEVIVIDNNSKDKTAKIARSKGARVIKEMRQGKGFAMITGFKSVSKDADYVVMIDGDASYDIKELPRLLEPLESNFGDVIVGTRLQGRVEDGSMTTFNRVGNWLFTFLARIAYKTNVTDVCSGFYAFQKYVTDQLGEYLESNGFSIEMEMVAKMAKMQFKCYSVPISLIEREGESHLRPIVDGSKIFKAWARNLFWNPAKAVYFQNPVSVAKPNVEIIEYANEGSSSVSATTNHVDYTTPMAQKQKA